MRVVLRIAALVLGLAGLTIGGCVLGLAEFAFEGDPGAAQIWYFGLGITLGLLGTAVWLLRATRRDDDGDQGGEGGHE